MIFNFKSFLLSLGGLDNLYVISTLGGFLAIAILLEVKLIQIKKDLKGPDALRNFYNMFNEEVYIFI